MKRNLFLVAIICCFSLGANAVFHTLQYCGFIKAPHKCKTCIVEDDKLGNEIRRVCSRLYPVSKFEKENRYLSAMELTSNGLPIRQLPKNGFHFYRFYKKLKPRICQSATDEIANLRFKLEAFKKSADNTCNYRKSFVRKKGVR